MLTIAVNEMSEKRCNSAASVGRPPQTWLMSAALRGGSESFI
jgi:hypothetical protein